MEISYLHAIILEAESESDNKMNYSKRKVRTNQYVYKSIDNMPKDHDIVFNAAMLENQGCSFQNK